MNKFKARKAKRTVNGLEYKFDSQAEARFFDRLSNDMKYGSIKGFSTQPQFVLTGGFVIDTDKNKSGRSKVPGLLYTADFRIFENDGTETIIEVKGKITTDYIMRRKLFLAQAWVEFGVSRFVEVIRGVHTVWDCESVKEIN